MNLYYILFESLKPVDSKGDKIKSNSLRWAFASNTIEEVMSKAEEFGNNPQVVAGPYKMNKDWV